MKRYLVFYGDDYYPFGGWDDFKSAHDSLSEAIMAVQNLKLNSWQWHQIVDTTTLKEVQ